MKTIYFKRTILLNVILFIVLSCGMQALNAQNIFHADTWNESELSNEQSERYAKVLNQLLRGQTSSSPLISSLANLAENANIFDHFGEADILNDIGEGQLRKVRIDAISELDGNRIEVNIPTSFCDNISFKGKNVKFISDDDYSWYGELEFDGGDRCACSNGYLLLMAKNGEKFGQLKLENESYSIEDIGGKQLIVRMPANEENTLSCGVGLADIEESHHGNPGVESRNNGTNCSVTILGLYTASADESRTNIENIITESVEMTNQALRNSAISSCDLNFELVAAEEIAIDETGRTFLSVLNEMRSFSSLAQNRKAFYDADIVILFVNRAIMASGEPAGLAAVNPSLGSSAFGVVRSFGASWNLIFAHEVGHIMGALHEPCAAQDANPAPSCNNSGTDEHAHTWSRERGCKTIKNKTILYSSVSGDVIPHYSNPDVSVIGSPTGITNTRNNARVLTSNACKVANFETGDNEYLSANISGDYEICEYDAICLSTTASGQPGPYTYEWKISDSGINWNATPVSSTTNTLCISTPLSGFSPGDVIHVLLKVTAGDGTERLAYHSVEIIDDGRHGIDCAKSFGQSNDVVLESSPNPANSFTNIEFDIADKSEVVIRVYDLNGYEVSKIHKGEYLAGKHNERLDLSHLKSGLYFVELSTNLGVRRTPIIKM